MATVSLSRLDDNIAGQDPIVVSVIWIVPLAIVLAALITGAVVYVLRRRRVMKRKANVTISTLTNEYDSASHTVISTNMRSN